MLSHFLALAVLATTSFFANSAGDFKGTLLASCFSEEEATGAGSHQEGSFGSHWKEGEKKIAKVDWSFGQPPYLQRSRNPFFCATENSNDVVLSEVSNSKQFTYSIMPSMPATLDGSLEAAQAFQKQESKEAEGSAKHTTDSAGSAEAQEGLGRAGKRSKLGGVSQSCALGTIHTSRPKFEQELRCFHGGHRVAGCASSTSSSTTACSIERVDRGRDPIVESFERSEQSQCGALPRVATTERCFVGKGKGSYQQQGIVTWTPEPTPKVPTTGGFSGNQAETNRCRMARFCQGRQDNSPGACSSVSSSEIRPPGTLQREDAGAHQGQGGSHTSFPGPAKHSQGAREIASHGIESGRPDTRSASGDSRSGTGLGNFRRRSPGCQSDGGGSRGRCPGSHGDFGISCSSEGQIQDNIPGIPVTTSCGQSISQDQERAQRQMKLNGAQVLHDRVEALSVSLQASVHNLRHRNFTWTLRDESDQCEQPMFRSSTRKRPTIRFGDEVHVILFHEDQVVEGIIPCLGKQGWTRTFWHLHGQICQWEWMCKAFCNLGHVQWSALSSDEVRIDSGSIFDSSVDLESRGHIDPTSSTSGSQRAFEQVQSRLANAARSSRVLFAETWYLSRNRFDVCVQSRRVPVAHDTSFHHFQVACKQTWNEVLTDDEISFQIVHPTPVGMASTLLHVILIQGEQADLGSLLVHVGALPILANHRAVLYKRGDPAIQVFRNLQLQRMCTRTDAFCVLNGLRQGNPHTCENTEPVDFDEATLAEGHLMVLDRSSDDEVESLADRSTQVDSASESHEDGSGDESSLMSILECHSSLQDNPQPYPWQVWHAEEVPDDDTGPNDEVDPQDDVFLAEEHQRRIARFVAQGLPEGIDGPNAWLAITFGLGLVDLGRRDVLVDVRDLPALKERVWHLWQDHAQHGYLDVQVVNPQPVLAARPSIVLLVVVRYSDTEDLDQRSVLVIEDSAFDVQHRSTPYATHVTARANSRSIALHLGFHHCYPIGLRRCEAVVGGVQLHDTHYAAIHDGDLCSTFVGAYPECAFNARHILANHDDFFLRARYQREARGSSGQVMLRVHGISPRNVPLGHRDWILTFEQIEQEYWIADVQSLWHFHEFEEPRMSFVAHMTAGLDAQIPVFHLIVSYARSHSGRAVLVNQRMTVRANSNVYDEQWAIMLKPIADETEVFHQLSDPPFWFHDFSMTSMRRQGRHLYDDDMDWQHGDCLDLFSTVPSNSDALEVMLHTYMTRFDPVPMDSVELLQLGVKKLAKQHPFVEVCRDACHFTKEVRSESATGTFPFDAQHNAGEPEGNTDLRSPARDHVVQGSVADLKQVVQALLDNTWKGLNCDFTAVHPLHPAAQYAIAHTTSNQHSNCFHIFTDGSCKGQSAAWAFVVLCEHQDANGPSYSRIGYAGARMPPKKDGRWTAADTEAAAIINMADYLLARPWVQGMQLHCHFDAKAIGLASFGDQNVYKKLRDIQSLPYRARVVMTMVQRKFHCSPFHVHAHQSNPFNEAADSIAGFLRRGYDVPVPAESRLQPLFAHPLCEWAWLEVCPDIEVPDLETILQDADRWRDQAWMDSTLKPAFDPCPVSGAATAFHLQLATANVGTLNYQAGGEGVVTSVKSKELAKQFTDHGWDIICLQETRARHDAMANEGPFTRLIASGTRGQAGVEIWLNIDNLNDKFKCTIDPSKDIVVWHSSPRVIAAHVSFNGWKMDVVSCYAPQRGRPFSEVQQWWEELHTILNTRSWQGPLWIGGDFNCAVGSHCSDHVGTLNPDFEDPAGELFHDFARSWNLRITNTHEEVFSGHSWTYEGPRGARSRIDYILVSEDLWPGLCRVTSVDTVESLTGGHDHTPLLSDIVIQHAAGPQAPMKRQMIYDRHKARSATTDIDLVSCLPGIPWQMAANEHWSNIRDCLQNAAKMTFPKGKRQRRQVYFSDKLWALVCHKKDIKQQHKHQQQTLRWLILRQMFHAWKGSQAETRQISDNVHLLRLQEAVTFEQRLRIDQSFKQEKRIAWREWIEANMADKASQLSRASGSELFRILQPKKIIAKHQGKSRRAHPGLKCDDGTWCRSRVEIASAWQAQFQQTEHAFRVQAPEFLSVESDAMQSHDVKRLREIPTLCDVEWALRNMDSKKAPGLDGLGAELFQQHIANTSLRVYPLFLKLALREEWVPEMSGGWLLPLWKGKGSTTATASYRGIMLEPVLARTFSRSWRPKAERGVSAMAQPGQWGGRPGLSCTALHLRLKVAQQDAATRGISQAIIFVDVKAAFYSVAKPLLHYGTYSESEFQAVCNAMQIPATARSLFAANLRKTNAMWEATKSQALTAMTSATLSRTWYAIPDGDGIFAPLTGSRPGDPLADLFYSAIMATILQCIDERATAQGLFPEPDADQPVSTSVTWVDDLAVILEADAASLCHKAIHMLAIIIDVTTEFGFELSVGPGKTAVMLSFRGTKARQSRVACERQHAKGLPVLSEHRGLMLVPLVHYYKHLGGFLSKSGATFQEIKVRGSLTFARVAPLRKILRDSRIALKHKQTLVKTMGWSVMTLHAGSWWNLTEGEYQAWQGAWHKVTSCLYARETDGAVTKVTMQQRALDLCSPMPMEMLYIQRLRLFAHLLQEADIFMIHALLRNRDNAGHESWLSAAQHAVHWLQQQVGMSHLVQAVSDIDSYDKWQQAATWGIRLKKAIHKAEKAHQLRLRAFCDLHDAEQMQSALLKDMGWTKEVAADPIPEPTSVQCRICDFVAKDHASLAVHEQRKHQMRVAVRLYAEDGVCRICRKQFHTRPRLILHLHNGTSGCWFRLMRACSPMSVEQARVLDEEDRQRGVALHQRGMKNRDDEFACRSALDDEMPSTLHWHGQLDVFPEGEPQEHELVAWRQHGMLPPGKGGRQQSTRGASAFSIPNVLEDTQQLEKRLQSEVRCWNPFFDFVPRPLVEDTKYVLILCSGHRRHGDIAHFIHQDSSLVPISVDTAVSMEHGNIYQSSKWIDLVCSRKVVAAHGAPPCETFTLARWMDVGTPGFPQPMRTKDYPYGLPEMSLRELIQCINGGSLFLQVFGLLMLVFAAGGAVTLEHPRGPQDPDHLAWTVWASSMMRRFLLEGDVQMFSFVQGPLGRPFWKPTTLMAGRLRSLPHRIFSAYDPKWKPTSWLGGKRADGQWRTTEAKAYPPKLCEVLAHSYIDFAETVPMEGFESDPKGIEPALHALTAVLQADEEGQMCSDFQLANFR